MTCQTSTTVTRNGPRMTWTSHQHHITTMCNNQHIIAPNYMSSKLIANSHTSHMTCQRIELQCWTHHKLKKLNQDIILIKAQDMENPHCEVDVFDPNGMQRRCGGQDMKPVCDTMHASCIFRCTCGSCICTSKCTDQNMGPAAPEDQAKSAVHWTMTSKKDAPDQ